MIKIIIIICMFFCLNGLSFAGLDFYGQTSKYDKLDATVAPDADNDVDEGYAPGSIWVDVTNDKFYVCIDATDGAAIWDEGGGGAGTDDQRLDEVGDPTATKTFDTGAYTVSFDYDSGGGHKLGNVTGGHYIYFQYDKATLEGDYYIEGSQNLSSIDVDGEYGGILDEYIVDSGVSYTVFGQAMHIDTDGELINADDDAEATLPVIGLLCEAGVSANITDTTIAFVDSNPDTITDSGNGFVSAGFVAGKKITVSGTVSNNGSYTIATVAAGTITLIAADSLTAESAGSSFTIKAIDKIIITHGLICEADWAWTIGGYVYVSGDPSTTEGLTQVVPTTNFGQIIGTAKTADCIMVDIQQYVEF